MCVVRIALIPLSIVLLGTPLSPVSPQTPSQPGQTVQTPPPARPPQTPIPVASIPQRVDAARGTLSGIQEHLGRTQGVDAILGAIPAFTETLASALEDPAFRPGEGASLLTLGSARRRWVAFQVRLAEWKRTLDPPAQRLAAEQDSLNQTRRLWEQTRANAIDEGAPDALLLRVNSLLNEIDETDIRLRDQLDRVLSALDQVTWGQRSIDEVLTQITAAEIAAQSRLFAPDSPPLWQVIRAPRDTLTLAWEVRASWRGAREGWSRYTRGSGEEIVFSLGVFLFLLVLLRALYRQATEWSERGQQPLPSVEFEKTLRFLSRPISAAALLTALAWRLAFPVPSMEVGAVIMVALVVPWVRLLPASIAGDLRKPIYALAGLWVLGEGTLLILDRSLLQRLALLITALIAGAGLYWAVRPGSAIRGPVPTRWSRTAMVAGQIGIVVMGAAVVANVVGFLSLAELLTRATIHSAAAALVLATIVPILDALIWTLLHTVWARKLRVVRNHSGRVKDRVLMLSQIGLFFLWLSMVSRQFGIHRAVVGGVQGALRPNLTIGTFAISLGDILAFTVILWLSLIVARGIRLLLEEDVLQSVSLPRGVPAAISTLVHYAAVFVGFLMAAAAAGFDLSRFTLLAGAFGVGLGFGLQNVVNNFVSGLILIFERPVQVGDVVEVGGVQGHVQRIGIRASTVRTWGGAEVIVPNGDLISQQVTNWTLSDRLRRMEIAVGVRYGTDPQGVIDLLTTTVSRHPGVLPDPPVSTLFQGFGQSSLDFVVRAWTSSDDWRIVNSDLYVAVNNALKEAEIEIPFPQRELHLRPANPELKLGE